jgi:parvulin-like peptidyl-prolyl isomerase
VKSLPSRLCLHLVRALTLTATIVAAGASAQATQATNPAGTPLFATVNGKPVTLQEYEAAFTATMREKFYHGKVPDGEMAAVREQVKDKLVQRVLILEEADRRGVMPDGKVVADEVATYEARYAASPMWQQNRERLLPGLTKQLEERSRLEVLEKEVRGTPALSEADILAYYNRHPEQFTEPEKVRLSVILLGVDPSAGGAAWQQAREEAKTLHNQLAAGADFAEAARLRSSGRFAEEGGNAGYLHRGMLPEALQQKIDAFKIGAVAEPIDVLEGVAIFRLDERVAARKRDFADVAPRARELALREYQDKAWSDFVKSLSAKADIKLVFNHTGSESKR